MNEINEEIKQTLNLMQTDIDYEAHSELQCHLACLLEIKRNELQQRLVEPADGMGSVVKFDQAPYKSVRLDGQVTAEAKQLTTEELKAGLAFVKDGDEDKPLTTDELMSGCWWCADTSEDALKAFNLYGLVEYSDNTPWDGSYYACFLYAHGSNSLDRGSECHTSELKQIHRIGNEFYWGDDL